MASTVLLFISLSSPQTPFKTCPSIMQERVVDTTGAGDAFIGSMLVGLMNGMSKTDSLRLAATVAALKCTALGARPGLPHRDALEGLL